MPILTKTRAGSDTNLMEIYPAVRIVCHKPVDYLCCVLINPKLKT